MPESDGVMATLPIYWRCSATLFLTRHDPMLESRVNERGETILHWRCRDCFRIVGATEPETNTDLQERLKRPVWLK